MSPSKSMPPSERQPKAGELTGLFTRSELVVLLPLEKQQFHSSNSLQSRLDKPRILACSAKFCTSWSRFVVKDFRNRVLEYLEWMWMEMLLEDRPQVFSFQTWTPWCEQAELLGEDELVELKKDLLRVVRWVNVIKHRVNLWWGRI